MVAIRPTTLLRIDRYFDWRGKDISRLEGFSDAAFALMLTLLVVSSVVPNSYEGLVESMADFPAFALTKTLKLWSPIVVPTTVRKATDSSRKESLPNFLNNNPGN